MLKGGKQAAYGDFDHIVSSGFNVDEILDSYNQALKD